MGCGSSSNAAVTKPQEDQTPAEDPQNKGPPSNGPKSTKPPGNDPTEKQKTKPIARDTTIPGKVETSTQDDDDERALRQELYAAIKADLTRSRMRHATSLRQRVMLSESLSDFSRHQLDERDGDLSKANDTMELLRCRDELTAATEGSDLNEIYKAIYYVRERGYGSELMYEILQGRQKAYLLTRAEHSKNKSFDLDLNALLELKGYSQPPKEVHRVVAATLLYLGNNESRTESWSSCQALLTSTGLRRFRRQMLLSSSVHPEISARTTQMLEELSLQRVTDLSARAAALYVWVMGASSSAEQAEPASLERQKELLGQQDQQDLTPRQWAERSWSKESDRPLTTEWNTSRHSGSVVS